MSLDDPMARKLRKLESDTRRRATRDGIDFKLPVGYTTKLYEDQDGRCRVTGIKFSLEEFERAFVAQPFAPSVDRIRSERPYTRANVRLVCVAVNFAMNQWGEAVFLRLARAAVERHAIVSPATDAEWFARQLGRIKDAQDLLLTLPKQEQMKQRRRIAGLKAALAKGPVRLSEIAKDAAKTRQRNRRKSKPIASKRSADRSPKRHDDLGALIAFPAARRLQELAQDT